MLLPKVAELEVYVRGPVLSLGCGTEGVDCGGDGELVDDGAGGVQAETSPDAPPASASDPSGACAPHHLPWLRPGHVSQCQPARARMRDAV